MMAVHAKQDGTCGCEHYDFDDPQFTCIGCGRTCGYCMGRDDDMPDHCDDCWDKAHSEKEAATDRIGVLRSAIIAAMGPDPHTKREPHPDTVDALLGGLLARIAVSNARPAAYADEPWREQTAADHLSHACGHCDNAWISVRPYGKIKNWTSDLNQPEAAHAGLRLDFALWKFGRKIT